MAEEERDPYERIASVVALGVDHTAVSFSADDRSYAFHLGYHIHFAYRACAILASMRLGYIAQCACGGHVADRVPRCMTQDIVSYADERIFLAEHLAVLTNDRQAVHIRINDEAYIRLTGFEQVADLGQVLRQGFRIMGKLTIRRAVQFDDVLDPYGTQDSRDSQTTD